MNDDSARYVSFRQLSARDQIVAYGDAKRLGYTPAEIRSKLTFSVRGRRVDIRDVELLRTVGKEAQS